MARGQHREGTRAGFRSINRDRRAVDAQEGRVAFSANLQSEQLSLMLGGYARYFVDGDINVRTFMDILAINIKGLEEHANYNMLERDMAHDFGNNNVPLFQKNHPDAKANSLIGKLEKGTEAHHLLKYIENAEVLLYYVNKNLKWNTGPNQAKENNCIISGDTESRCTMLELYPESINLPDSVMWQTERM